MPYQDLGVRFVRPGWKGNMNPQEVQRKEKIGVILHIGYDKCHIAPSCTLNLPQRGQVLENYKSLTYAQK